MKKKFKTEEILKQNEIATLIFGTLEQVTYFKVLNKRGDPNQRVVWEDFFSYYIKNSGEGRNFFRLLHEKQEVGVKIAKIK